MKFLKRFRDTFLALLPILVIVFFVHIFFYKFQTEDLIKFVVAIMIATVGETLLLMGIDSTIMPMGELMVNSVMKASRFVIFLIFAVLFGAFATIAEPDVAIFSGQVVSVGVNTTKTILTFLIGAGVGIFIAIGVPIILLLKKNMNSLFMDLDVVN